MTFADVILRGTRANQPSFLVAPVGALYFVTDENVIERNAGTSWQSYSAPVSTGDVVGPASATDFAIARFDGITGKLIQNTPVTIDDTGMFTFPDNIKQIFNPGATNPGLNIGSFAGDPSAPANGDVWYNSTSNEFRARINGATVSLGAAATPEVLRARVVIPHASILTNNTVPIQIVAAPAATEMIQPLSVTTIKQCTAGGYSANPNFSLRYNTLATDLNTALSLQILTADKRNHRFPLTAMTTTQIFTPPPLGLALMFRGTADVTGGNAANYIVVEVTYTIVVDGP
jgi:hypothetical protein